MALTARQRLTVCWDSVAVGLAAREQTRIDCVAFSNGEKVSERFESCLFMERYVGEKTVFNPFRPAAASQSFSLCDAIVAVSPFNSRRPPLQCRSFKLQFFFKGHL